MKKEQSLLQKGISLLEVMLSLSIIAVILVMATRYYETAHRNDALNNLVEQVGALEGAIVRYADTNGSYNVTLANLVAGSYYPTSSSYDSVNKTLRNGLGNITLENASAAGVTIQVAMGTTQQTMCERLKASYAGAACAAGTFTFALPNNAASS